MDISKARIIQALRGRLQADLDAVSASQKETEDGATHEESRPENDKDTRALESTYLARGLAQRVTELNAAVAKLDAMQARLLTAQESVALGALVTAEDEHGAAHQYFMAPAGGGTKLQIDGVIIKVITPVAPLGRALLRSVVGDEVTLSTPRGARTLEVVAVA